MTMPRKTKGWRRTGSTERPMTVGWRKALQKQGRWAPGSVWEQTEGEWLRGTIGLGRGKPARREPGRKPQGQYPRAWVQEVARWALWVTRGGSRLAGPVGRDNGTAAQCGSSACLKAWRGPGDPAGRSGKGKGPPRAPGKGRRGQRTGGKQTRSLDRKRPNTPKQRANNDRRKERAGNRLATKAAELLQGKRPDDAKKNPRVAAQWFD